MTTYKVSLDRLTFYAEKQVIDKGLTMLRLGVLNSGASCISIQIFTNPLEFNLLEVSFDSKCASNKIMISASLQLLKTLYPECKELTLQDNSFYVCPENKKNISLANYNFMLYGKTWYQRYFNAKYLGNIDEQRSLLRAIDTLKLPYANFTSYNKYFKSLTCEEFSKVQGEFRKKLIVPNLDGSEWVIDEFPEIKIDIEEGVDIVLQDGGYRRKGKYHGLFTNLK